MSSTTLDCNNRIYQQSDCKDTCPNNSIKHYKEDLTINTRCNYMNGTSQYKHDEQQQKQHQQQNDLYNNETLVDEEELAKQQFDAFASNIRQIKQKTKDINEALIVLESENMLFNVNEIDCVRNELTLQKEILKQAEIDFREKTKVYTHKVCKLRMIISKREKILNDNKYTLLFRDNKVIEKIFLTTHLALLSELKEAEQFVFKCSNTITAKRSNHLLN